MQDDSSQVIQSNMLQRIKRHPRVVVLSVIVCAIVAFVVISGVRDAEQQRAIAEERRIALQDTQFRFGESNFFKGLVLINRGDSDWGLLWLAEALKELPERETDLRKQIHDEIAATLHIRRPLLRETKVQKPITGFYESQDGKQVFIVSGAVGQVYDINGMPVGKPIRHGTAILAATFSPDGQRIAIGGTAAESENEFVARYSIETGEQSGLRFQTGSQRPIQTLAWKGDYIAAGQSHDLYLWDTKTGQTTFPPKQLSGMFAAMEFDDNNIVVLQAGTPSQLTKFDIQKGEQTGAGIELTGLSLGISTPSSLRVIDGKYRTVNGGLLRIWNPTDGKLLEVLQLPGPDSYVSRSYSITDGEAIRFLTLSGNHLKEHSLHHRETVVGVMADQQGVLSVSSDGWLRRWGELGQVAVKLGSPVRGVSVSPDGKQMLAYGDAGHAALYDVQKQSHVALPIAKRIQTTLWESDSRTYYTAWDKTLQIWHGSDGKTQRDQEGKILHIQDSKLKMLIASQGNTNSRYEWYDEIVNEKKPTGKLSTIDVEGILLGIEYAQKYQQVQLVIRDGDEVFLQLNAWEKSEPILRQKLPGVKLAEFGKVLFAPDASWVAIPGVGEVSFWFRDTNKFWSYPLDPGDRITSMITNPTSDILYVGSATGKLYAVEIATDKFIWQGRGHRDGVTAMALSPGGSRLISAGKDGVVQQWDIKTGDAVGPRYPHPTGVTTLALLPNRRFAAGCIDGSVRIWSTDPKLPNVSDLREHIQRTTGLKLRAIYP